MLESTIRRIKALQRWDGTTIRILGMIELLLAGSLGVNALFAFAIGEDASYFSYIFPIVGGLGLFQTLFFSSKEKLSPAVGILLIAVMWGISFIVASLPFIIYGMNVADAFFEGISGYTTTGATIVDDLNALPDSLLLWRGIIQWTGGITVLISFAFLLPAIGMGAAGLSSNEFTGSDDSGYTQKITSASLNFLKVYALLTIGEILALAACSVSLFDSLCIALSNVPTGGLLPRNESMACYSIYAQAVTLIFMILGSTNFYLVFRAMFKRDAQILRNGEERAMLAWFALVSVIVLAAFVIPEIEGLTADDFGESLWKSVYSVISSGTGTGFAIFSYSQLYGAGNLAFIFFMLMMVEFMGGASGSTAGGIKIYRMMALKSYITISLRRVLHPNAVVSIRSNGRTMDDEALNSALSTVFLFIVGTLIGIAIIMVCEPDLNLQEQFGVTLAAITNAGIGPLDSYGSLSVVSKVAMCFMMWLGRMEMVLIIVLFTREFWSDLRLEASSTRSRHHTHVAERRRKH